MEYFQTKNSNFRNFWRSLEWKRLVYSVAIWNILRPFVFILLPFSGNLVYFPRFDTLCQEKSGNLRMPSKLQITALHSIKSQKHGILAGFEPFIFCS
jgi:hypothetical protein